MFTLTCWCIFWCILGYFDVYWCILVWSGVLWCILVYTWNLWCSLVYSGVFWCILVYYGVFLLAVLPYHYQGCRHQEGRRHDPLARQRNEYLLNKQSFSKIRRNGFFLLFCTMKYYIQKLLEVCWEKYKYIFPEIFHSIINLLYRFKFAK